jgi:hypothetical protein
MALREVRYQLARLCWRWLAGTVDSDLRRGAAGESRKRVDVSFAAAQWELDIPANECTSAAQVARKLLGSNSNASITNVLVIGRNNATPPVKRTEIHLRHSNEVPATLKLLATTLETSGISFRAVQNPGMPMTEIWLTCPLHDGKTALLSCAAIEGVHSAQPVSAKPISPRNAAQ